ncbi:MAG: SAM-dependent methyltransferase [Flavobacteriaceae bacterium]|nr:SAM-dependent methyltransferase [Flavobacteriaceae bacterium]
MDNEKYFEINRQTWDNKVPIHLDSEFYDQKSFLEGKNSLPDIDIALLGNIQNKSILHLQCHFGQDSISMARMDAKVTGLDLDNWAKIISQSLKPCGKLVFVEFHPFVWMFDDNFKEIKYHYHNERPIIEEYTRTYADKNAAITTDYIGWNHSLSEVFSSLIKNGLEIIDFREYDYSPYNCFNETIEFEKDKFRIKHFENKIPMLYSLTAIRK